MKIAWGITGAGHYLRDSVKIIEELVEKHHIVDVFFSAAGETVAHMYNVLDSVETLHKSFPKYLHSIIYDKNQTPGYPICAHFNLHRYDLLIISPLTANSVGKMNAGIADTIT